MTIAQALRRINKLKGQVKAHLDRAQVGVTWREDASPAFAFSSSLEAADGFIEELVHLRTALRVANARTRVVGREMTLAEAVVRLEETKARIAWLQGLPVRAQAEGKDHAGFVKDDKGTVQAVGVPVHCALPEAKRVEVVEGLQAYFDALNDAVETTNHRTDV